jgi:sirohydrochlorin cobaltochelatase
MPEPAVLLCGHGSRDPAALAEFAATAAALRACVVGHDFATGYLEFARPTIGEGLAALAARGATRIVAVPAMLLAASHVRIDLPAVMRSFVAAHPDIEVRLGRDLASEAALLGAAADRIGAAAPDRRIDSLLLVVGRGSNDPGANAGVAEIARLLGEGMGFGRAEVAFSGIAQPLVDAALERAAGLGFRRIVVFPYFLFTGVLVKRIYHHTDMAAARFPAIEFVRAHCLRDHVGVIGALAARVAEETAAAAAEQDRCSIIS